MRMVLVRRFEAVTREISIFEQILFSLWKPFFAVVERDWKGVR